MAEKLAQLKKKKGGGGEDIDEIIANRKSVQIQKSVSATWSGAKISISLADVQARDANARYVIGISSSSASSTQLYGIRVQPTFIDATIYGPSSSPSTVTWTVTVDYI